MELFVFVVAAGMVLGGAVGVIVRSHPVHAALSLVLTLFGGQKNKRVQDPVTKEWSTLPVNKFLDADNLVLLVKDASFIAIMAIGMTAIIVMSGIDLSIGSIYALFGGLRSVAVSDTLNGVGLLVGGFLITGYALSLLGGDGGTRRCVQKNKDINSCNGGCHRPASGLPIWV